MSEDRWQLFALKPCEECQGTGETIIEKHDCDCPDCLGTGYEEPAKRIMNLERELSIVKEERDGAFALIEYAGELLGVKPEKHKSAHGFAVLQAIKDLIGSKQ